MIRTTGIFSMVLVSLALCSAPMRAQPGNAGPGVPGQGLGQNQGRHGYDGIIPSRVILVRVLHLTDEQLAQVEGLIEEIQNTLGPLREELGMLTEDLQMELSMEDPDPLIVGEIVITMHNLKGEIEALRQAFRASFLSILTDEQLTRLEEFINSHHPGPDGPAPEDPSWGPRPN